MCGHAGKRGRAATPASSAAYSRAPANHARSPMIARIGTFPGHGRPSARTAPKAGRPDPTGARSGSAWDRCNSGPWDYAVQFQQCMDRGLAVAGDQAAAGLDGQVGQPFPSPWRWPPRRAAATSRGLRPLAATRLPMPRSCWASAPARADRRLLGDGGGATCRPKRDILIVFGVVSGASAGAVASAWPASGACHNSPWHRRSAARWAHPVRRAHRMRV